MNHKLPADFKDWAKGFFQSEYCDFKDALGAASVTSIRLNAAKASRLNLPVEPIPWHPNGYYLVDRPAFSQDPLWHAGAYYVQEASSMMVHQVIQQLHLPQDCLAIDMCAAPGGKATLLIDSLPENSLLIANEVIKTRGAALFQNLERWGEPSVLTGSYDPAWYAKIGAQFDLVLVDAPCSGEGLFRKNEAACDQWSVEHVNHCSARQSRILEDAAMCVKEGGFLIYATCTYNEQENYLPISKLLKTGAFDSVAMIDLERFGVMHGQFEGVHGYHCFPHKVKGEGFYFSVLQKTIANKSGRIQHKMPGYPASSWPDNWLPEIPGVIISHKGQVFFVPEKSESALGKLQIAPDRFKRLGALGHYKGKFPIPSHTLAQMRYTPGMSSVELSLEDAIRYLRKDSNLNIDVTDGWHRVDYGGLGIGWIKKIPGRTNNYFPTEIRLK